MVVVFLQIYTQISKILGEQLPQALQILDFFSSLNWCVFFFGNEYVVILPSSPKKNTNFFRESESSVSLLKSN